MDVDEREYSLSELADMFDIARWRLKYAVRTRRVPQRVVGRILLVTPSAARLALADVNPKHDPYKARKSA